MEAPRQFASLTLRAVGFAGDADSLDAAGERRRNLDYIYSFDHRSAATAARDSASCPAATWRSASQSSGHVMERLCSRHAPKRFSCYVSGASGMEDGRCSRAYAIPCVLPPAPDARMG